MGKAKYRIKPIGGSSKTYGPCEVCESHVSDVHMLIMSGGPVGLIVHLFGHQQCLQFIAKTGFRNARNVRESFDVKYHGIEVAK